MKSPLPDLHLKFAEKTWNDTFKLVRKCMDKSKDASKPHGPLVKALERLQETFNVSSIDGMKSRLELVAKQQGMGFHFSQNTCYLTADLFYLEVVLLPSGEAAQVKMAVTGHPPLPSESFLQPLRSKNFAEFSKRLAGVSTQHNIPGDSEFKLKLFTSLQHVVKDLHRVSVMLREPRHSDAQVDVICNGRVGRLVAEREDRPLTIQFYINPSNEMKTSDPYVEPAVQAAQVTVALSGTTHQLQMASTIADPARTDPLGRPAFSAEGDAPHEALPACFLLKLQPPVPMLSSFVDELSRITDVTIPDADLQWAPLPKLLLSSSQSRGLSEKKEEATEEQQEAAVAEPLCGGGSHACVFPTAEWNSPVQRAAMVDKVPFTRPAHVPPLLELLRHQCAINAILSSGMASSGSVCDLPSEVLPVSDTCFSVTVHLPYTDTLAVLVVDVPGPRLLSCRLFGAGVKDGSLDEYVSGVTRRCMSIPLTLTALHAELERSSTAPPRPASEAGSDTDDVIVADLHSAVTSAAPSQHTAEDDTCTAVRSVPSGAKYEPPLEINLCHPGDAYQISPVVFPDWFRHSHLSEKELVWQRLRRTVCHL